jgi:hypothetical protein
MGDERWEGGSSPRGRRLPLALGALAAVAVLAVLARPAGPPPGGEAQPEPIEVASEAAGAEAAPTDELMAQRPATAPETEPGEAIPALDPTRRWRALSAGPLTSGLRGPAGWDGERLVLWPGRGNGAAYAVAVDAWGSLPPAPVERLEGWTATWTGEEMAFWGGLDQDGAPTADGALFDPLAWTWRVLPAAPLGPRTGHAATWGGGRLWIFGGIDAAGQRLADGAAFDPATGEWRLLAEGPLSGRSHATLAWFEAEEGGELLVWGGLDGREAERDGAGLVDGARLRPDGAWVPMASAPVPMRGLAATAWTGTERCPETGSCGNLHVWGRPIPLSARDGHRYDAHRGQWDRHPLLLNQTRSGAVGLWTGGTTIVFGGRDQFDRGDRADGFIFDANSGRWAQLPAVPGDPGPEPVVAWTGAELLVWGRGEGWRLPVDTASLRD